MWKSALNNIYITTNAITIRNGMPLLRVYVHGVFRTLHHDRLKTLLFSAPIVLILVRCYWSVLVFVF